VRTNTKVWIALWTVYLIWGSTYLGIKLAGETIPPVFAASTRFIAAGALMAAFVILRRGPRLLLPDGLRSCRRVPSACCC
jgi:drug/metabolite transporter (DMT)-like permease